mgnify:CR=1 FL=1
MSELLTAGSQDIMFYAQVDGTGSAIETDGSSWHTIINSSTIPCRAFLIQVQKETPAADFDIDTDATCFRFSTNNTGPGIVCPKTGYVLRKRVSIMDAGSDGVMGYVQAPAGYKVLVNLLY